MNKPDRARVEKYARAICAGVELPGAEPDARIKDHEHGSTYHALWEEHVPAAIAAIAVADVELTERVLDASGSAQA